MILWIWYSLEKVFPIKVFLKNVIISWWVEQSNWIPKFLLLFLFFMWPEALSWRGTTFFLLMSSGCFSIKILLTPCSYWIYTCAFSVSLHFKNSKLIIPGNPITCTRLPFFYAFGISCRNLSLSIHWFFCWTLLYATHFSSPVKIQEQLGWYIHYYSWFPKTEIVYDPT